MLSIFKKEDAFVHLYVTNLLHGFATSAAEVLIGSNMKCSYKIGLKTSLLDPHAWRSTAHRGISTRWPICKCNPHIWSSAPLNILLVYITDFMWLWLGQCSHAHKDSADHSIPAVFVIPSYLVALNTFQRLFCWFSALLHVRQQGKVKKKIKFLLYWLLRPPVNSGIELKILLPFTYKAP